MEAHGISGTTRIVIVDDHPFMRRGLSQTINHETGLEVCGEAAGVEEAEEIVERTAPHLVVVDISLGDQSGLDLIKRIQARHPHIRLLVCSMHEDSLFAERVLRAGAHGYVNKHEETDTFLEALRRVLSGGIYFSQDIADRMLCQLTGASTRGKASIESLSDRELHVFELIGRGLNTKQIALRLGLSRKTIETYRENIKAKLDLDGGAELTRHAVQWVLEQG